MTHPLLLLLFSVQVFLAVPIGVVSFVNVEDSNRAVRQTPSLSRNAVGDSHKPTHLLSGARQRPIDHAIVDGSGEYGSSDEQSPLARRTMELTTSQPRFVRQSVLRRTRKHGVIDFSPWTEGLVVVSLTLTMTTTARKTHGYQTSLRSIRQ